MKLFFDMSSVLWTGLLAGKDAEGVEVQHGSRKVTVNTCAYGYENVVNSMNAAIKEFTKEFISKPFDICERVVQMYQQQIEVTL